MGIVETIALSMGLGWASGLNLYATLFMLGVLQRSGGIELPTELLVVADPWVMAAAGFMYCVEFFADKFPGVDTGWDAIHTFIRIPAGAILAAEAVGPVSPEIALAAGLVGGGLAAGSHTLKASSRLAINTSPEPVTNWTASLAEDALVVGGLWTALHYPLVFLLALLVFVSIAIWLLPRIWQGLRKAVAFLTRRFRSPSPDAAIAMPADGARSDAAAQSAAEAARNTPLSNSQ